MFWVMHMYGNCHETTAAGGTRTRLHPEVPDERVQYCNVVVAANGRDGLRRRRPPYYVYGTVPKRTYGTPMLIPYRPRHADAGTRAGCNEQCGMPHV